MDLWDEDYFNLEVQAFIRVGPNGSGDFQFGLVAGQIEGAVVKAGNTERFEFTWEGQDEDDPALGNGWLKLAEKDKLQRKL